VRYGPVTPDSHARWGRGAPLERAPPIRLIRFGWPVLRRR
jgi:hypothetical protein